MKDLILIVDDNPNNIQFLASILESNNYDVAVALSGQQALSFLEKNSLPQLVLLDVMMPGMDGYEVCRRMKLSKDVKDIPVIFLTAKHDTEDLVKGFKSGGVDYLTKPFNSTELLVRMETHIELKKAREEIQTLRGMIPICAYCKKVRDDEGYWEQVEVYVQDKSQATFTHGICPDCLTTQREEINRIRTKMQREKD